MVEPGHSSCESNDTVDAAIGFAFVRHRGVRKQRLFMMTAPAKDEGTYNVVVIGAGIAGLVTAAGTAGLGGRVALIERNKMGGDCLNFGCVPSKALISSARLVDRIRRSEEWGLRALEPQIDFEGVRSEERRVGEEW